MKTIKAAREGWFTLEQEDPRLLGSQCVECKTYYFPENQKFCRNPNCNSENFDRVELSNKGRIWSYTNSEYAPPEPFIYKDPYEPFTLAAVELDKEKIIVLGQLKKGVTVDDVKIGDQVELILETLFEDADHEYLVWKWQPCLVTA